MTQLSRSGKPLKMVGNLAEGDYIQCATREEWVEIRKLYSNNDSMDWTWCSHEKDFVVDPKTGHHCNRNDVSIKDTTPIHDAADFLLPIPPQQAPPLSFPRMMVVWNHDRSGKCLREVQARIDAMRSPYLTIEVSADKSTRAYWYEAASEIPEPLPMTRAEAEAQLSTSIQAIKIID